MTNLNEYKQRKLQEFINNHYQAAVLSKSTLGCLAYTNIIRRKLGIPLAKAVKKVRQNWT